MKEFSNQVISAIKGRIPQEDRVEVSLITKNNGVVEHAVSILEKGKNISPTIYLEEFYKAYQKGIDIEEIADEIIRRNKEYTPMESIDIDFFIHYEKAKTGIVYKLINYHMNKELLEKIPYIRHLDLAIVFYYLFQNEREGNASILIHNSHLEMWKISLDDLYKQALENTPKILPAAITGMKEIVEQMMGEKFQEDTLEGEIPMYVMTNQMKMNGAATMLYPDAIRNFANAMGKNIYIIPSSVHEVILVPETGTEGGSLNEMVREVNETQVDPKEVLADHVYYYNREEDRVLSCVCEAVRYC